MEDVHLETVEPDDPAPGQIGLGYGFVAADGVCVAEAAILIYTDSIYVQTIRTDPDWQRRGLATRLLLHIIDELQPATVRAGTVSEIADALFGRLASARPNIVFDID